MLWEENELVVTTPIQLVGMEDPDYKENDPVVSTGAFVQKLKELKQSDPIFASLDPNWNGTFNTMVFRDFNEKLAVDMKNAQPPDIIDVFGRDMMKYIELEFRETCTNARHLLGSLAKKQFLNYYDFTLDVYCFYYECKNQKCEEMRQMQAELPHRLHYEAKSADYKELLHKVNFIIARLDRCPRKFLLTQEEKEERKQYDRISLQRKATETLTVFQRTALYYRMRQQIIRHENFQGLRLCVDFMYYTRQISTENYATNTDPKVQRHTTGKKVPTLSAFLHKLTASPEHNRIIKRFMESNTLDNTRMIVSPSR